MADSAYVVVAEIGLTKNSYGAEIRTSEAMTKAEAEVFVQRVLAGQEPDLFRPTGDTQILRVESIDQYLVVEGHRLRPDRLTRLSIATALARPVATDGT